MTIVLEQEEAYHYDFKNMPLDKIDQNEMLKYKYRMTV